MQNLPRIKKLRAGLSRPLLIKKKENLLYLTGRSFLHGYLLVKPRQAAELKTSAASRGKNSGVVFFGDGLEKISGIKSDYFKNLDRYLSPSPRPSPARREGELSVQVEDVLTLEELAYFKRNAQGVKFAPVSSPVDVLRAFKDKMELKYIGQAVELTARVFNLAKGVLRKKSRTEIELANFIRLQGLRLGAQDISFPPIVAAGENAAVPHHQPTPRKIKAGESLVIDLGFRLNNYCSDFTRTVFLKRVPRKLEVIYRQTQNAQFVAMREASVGIKGAEVHEAARKILAQKRLDKYFIHGLGHGTGLEVHEWPKLAPGSKDTLRPGMVFSLEPGVYIPKVGGVRLEDLVYLPLDAKVGSQPRLFAKVSTALEANVIK